MLRFYGPCNLMLDPSLLMFLAAGNKPKAVRYIDMKYKTNEKNKSKKYRVRGTYLLKNCSFTLIAHKDQAKGRKLIHPSHPQK